MSKHSDLWCISECSRAHIPNTVKLNSQSICFNKRKECASRETRRAQCPAGKTNADSGSFNDVWKVLDGHMAHTDKPLVLMVSVHWVSLRGDTCNFLKLSNTISWETPSHLTLIKDSTRTHWAGRNAGDHNKRFRTNNSRNTELTSWFLWYRGSCKRHSVIARSLVYTTGFNFRNAMAHKLQSLFIMKKKKVQARMLKAL